MRTDKEKNAQKSAPTFSYNRTRVSSLSECVRQTTNELQRIFNKETIPDVDLFLSQIDSIGQDMRKRSAFELTTHAVVDTLIDKIYATWEIDFDADQNSIRSLLPHTVLATKKGSCLGVSLLFLLIAESINCPLYGVLLPGHFFVRYDDGKTCRNIEPNKRGYNRSNEYYRAHYTIDKNPWYTMKNLSGEETGAVVFYTVANICRSRNEYAAAKKYYRSCLAVMQDFAEAWGNCAITYVSCAQSDSARLAFNRAYALRPGLAMLLQNIGAFELGQNRHAAAFKAFREGLDYFPDNKELLYGAAFSCYSLDMPDKARRYLNRLGIPNDTSAREFKLAQRIKKNREK
jgi:hypothetical protein